MGAARRIRLVVFDLDGTLVDSAGDIATAVNRTLLRLDPGVSPLSLETVRCIVGDGAKRLLERCLGAVGLDHSAEETLPIFLDSYRGCLLDTTVLYPGVTEALDRLCGRRLAVLTNKPGEMSRTILSGLGLGQRFACVYGGDDVPRHKPDPAGLLRILAETEVLPEQTAIIGDSAVDVRTGRAVGALTIGVTYGFDAVRLHEAGPDLTLDRIHDLPRALDAAGDVLR